LSAISFALAYGWESFQLDCRRLTAVVKNSGGCTMKCDDLMSRDMEEPIGLEQKVEKICGWSEDGTLAMNIAAWFRRNRREEK
jgi:hypothetical protein